MMTSVVDKYYRKIIQNIDNVRMKFDISSLLVKAKKHDSKINTNKNDISDNTSLIDTNKNNISDNTSLIDTNKNNVSDNLSKINTNTSDISNSKTDISNNYNFTQINKKKSDNNTTYIDTNRDNIATNLNTLNNIDLDLSNLRDRINTHQTDIQNINTNINLLSNSYRITDILIFTVTNNIIKTVNSSKPKFIIFKKNIIYNFKKDSFIQIDSSILLYFSKHYVNIQFFYLLLECIDDNNSIFKELKINITGTISKHGIIDNSSIIKIPYDMSSLKIKLSINLLEGQNRNKIVKILNFDNHIYFKILEK